MPRYTWRESALITSRGARRARATAAAVLPTPVGPAMTRSGTLIRYSDMLPDTASSLWRGHLAWSDISLLGSPPERGSPRTGRTSHCSARRPSAAHLALVGHLTARLAARARLTSHCHALPYATDVSADVLDGDAAHRGPSVRAEVGRRR